MHFLLCALCVFASFALFPSCNQRAAQNDPKALPSPRSPDAASTQPHQFECRWTDEPITIDGRADEEAWKHAQTIDNFRIAWAASDARKPHTSTKAKLLWDREYLYFFAEMDDTDLYADVKEHNGPIWTNDCFELFFKPADDKTGYYEFEVSPANTTMELFLPSRNSGGLERFKNHTHIEMKTAVRLRGTLNQWQDKDQGWSVEGRIRWRDFGPTGGRPNDGETWKFALCRVDVSVGVEGPELSTCAPLTQASFHRYEDYAPLRFIGPPATARVQWTNSRVIGYPDPPLPYTTENAFPKLKVFQPLYILQQPGSDRYLLLQHLGNRSGPARLSRFRNDPNADSVETLLDYDGLIYGMTTHPQFAQNGYVYLLCNGQLPNETKRRNRIKRYTIDRKPPYRFDPASELVILEWESGGHDGGDLAFGPDGYLYHAAGDGSTDSDADLRGQDLTHLNSTMIRIDVDHPDAGRNYSVPKDNPFISTPGARPEIWAYGFRNPWRIAFDRKTGALWVGRNGQDLWEQVYLVHKGENYGWSLYEGSRPFQPTRKQGPTPITFPIVDHPHSEMRSLTGGVVYYGPKLPELQGAYIYGDWSTGRIWGVKHDGKRVIWNKELARTTMQILGFRETDDGELLVIDQVTGIHRLVRAPATEKTTPFPTKLSETGLFLSTKNHTPDPALISYEVNSPLWSDGAAKQRFIAIPGDGTITVQMTHGWDFPEGTVLVKTFSVEQQEGNPASRKRIETRLFTKQLGQWAGYSYIWNDQQTDATLVHAAGEDRDYVIRDSSLPGGKRTQSWHYPSRTECMTCHSRAANFVLGLSTVQMNRDGQLERLERLGLLRMDYLAHVKEGAKREWTANGKNAGAVDEMMQQRFSTGDQREPKPTTLLPLPSDRIPRLVDPHDKSADLTSRARSYLHANCAICHVEAGGGNARLDLDWDVPASRTHLFEPPQHDTFGLPGARVIATGKPDSSVLLHRMAVRGLGQMPPLATSLPDKAAIEMLHQWILQSRLPPAEPP